MSILTDVDSVLRSNGYRVLRGETSMLPLLFEDHCLLGFVTDYGSASKLIKEWKTVEELFLRLNARFLRSAEQKAWNCYSVHLTTEVCSSEDATSLLAIEEDFTSTRKIAKAGVASRRDILRALSPLLPLQNGIANQMHDSQPNPIERFRDWPDAARKALTRDAPSEEILASLMRGK